ncbi:endonuclease VII domain-containing protein [Burkholderia multivorans]|nr:endonuclease VII domain-containing protein [Burkholderia multivorans]
MTRYGMTPAQYDDLLKKQNGCCALCGGLMERPVIDHCHQTGKVRGILCHPCNIKLPAVEDMGWVMLAWAYLEGDA